MWSGKWRTIVASCSSVERSREWEVAVESDVYPSLQLVHVGAGVACGMLPDKLRPFCP